MPDEMENNRRVCQMEKEAREKRLLAYADAIQKSTLEVTSQILQKYAFAVGKHIELKICDGEE